MSSIRTTCRQWRQWSCRQMRGLTTWAANPDNVIINSALVTYSSDRIFIPTDRWAVSSILSRFSDLHETRQNKGTRTLRFQPHLPSSECPPPLLHSRSCWLPPRESSSRFAHRPIELISHNFKSFNSFVYRMAKRSHNIHRVKFLMKLFNNFNYSILPTSLSASSSPPYGFLAAKMVVVVSMLAVVDSTFKCTIIHIRKKV